MKDLRVAHSALSALVLQLQTDLKAVKETMRTALVARCKPRVVRVGLPHNSSNNPQEWRACCGWDYGASRFVRLAAMREPYSSYGGSDIVASLSICRSRGFPFSLRDCLVRPLSSMLVTVALSIGQGFSGLDETSLESKSPRSRSGGDDFKNFSGCSWMWVRSRSLTFSRSRTSGSILAWRRTRSIHHA